MKSFYQNGSIESEICYLNDTLKDGKAIYYYPNHKIKGIEYYFLGQVDSLSEEFDSSGNIILRAMLFNGAMTSIYWYYSGKEIKYNARNNAGSNFYVLRFDQLGNKIKEEGLIVSREVIDLKYEGDSAKNEFAFAFYVALPPSYSTNVEVGLFKITNIADSAKPNFIKSKMVIEPFKEYPIISSVAVYKKIINEPGVYEVVCAGKMTDITTSLSTYDTVFENFCVPGGP